MPDIESAKDDLFESIVTDENLDDVTTPEEEQKKQEELEQEELNKAFEGGVARVLGEQHEEENKPEPEKSFFGMSEDEFKSVVDKAKKVDDIEARLTKLNDKAFGTIGQLKQSFDEFSNRVPNAVKPNISKETFKALAEYFGDEGISEALAQDFSSVDYGSSEFNGLGHDDLAKLESSMRAKIEAETDAKLLSIAHPDWEPLITKEWQVEKDDQGNEYQKRVFTDEFMAWTDTLSDAGKQAVFESNNPIELSKALTRFKDWRVKKEEVINEKRKRLENAITVDGGNNRQSASSSESAFNQGLKKVLGSKSK